jgi:hypothetical protein
VPRKSSPTDKLLPQRWRKLLPLTGLTAGQIQVVYTLRGVAINHSLQITAGLCNLKTRRQLRLNS